MPISKTNKTKHLIKFNFVRSLTKVNNLEILKKIKIANKYPGAWSIVPLLISIIVKMEKVKTAVEHTVPATTIMILKTSLLRLNFFFSIK